MSTAPSLPHSTYKSERSQMSFVEAKAEGLPMNQQAAEMQLLLPHGLRIGITNLADPALLKRS